MTTLEYIFGIAPVTSLLFAFYVYLFDKAFMYSLIEKLHAARNDLRAIGASTTQIREVTDSPDWDDNRKVRIAGSLPAQSRIFPPLI